MYSPIIEKIFNNYNHILILLCYTPKDSAIFHFTSFLIKNYNSVILHYPVKNEKFEKIEKFDVSIE